MLKLSLQEFGRKMVDKGALVEPSPPDLTLKTKILSVFFTESQANHGFALASKRFHHFYKKYLVHKISKQYLIRVEKPVVAVNLLINFLVLIHQFTKFFLNLV